MTLVLAETLLQLVGVYLVIGCLFGLAFVCLAVQRLDPAAARMPAGVRLLILSGAVVLWPLLAWKWLRRQTPPVA